MSKKIILLLSIFMVFSATSQMKHQIYYAAIDSAENLKMMKAYDKALIQYQKAFTEITFPQEKHLKAALVIAKKTKHSELQISYTKLLKERAGLIDQDYKQFIDSLYKVDQKIRNSKSIKAIRYVNLCKNTPNYKADPSLLKKSKQIVSDFTKIDSLNTLCLIEKINAEGFPSQVKVGTKSFNSVFSILIHFGLDSSKQNRIQPILDSALYKGDLPPFHYAYIIDCQKVRYKKEQLYCQYLAHNFQQLSQEKKDNVVRNRKKIGLYNNTYKYGGIFGKTYSIE